MFKDLTKYQIAGIVLFALSIIILLVVLILQITHTSSGKTPTIVSIQSDLKNIQHTLSSISSADISAENNCLKETLSKGANVKSIQSVNTAITDILSKINSAVMSDTDKTSLLKQVNTLKQKVAVTTNLPLCSSFCKNGTVYDPKTNECDLNPTTYQSNINQIDQDLTSIITSDVTTLPKGGNQSSSKPVNPVTPPQKPVNPVTPPPKPAPAKVENWIPENNKCSDLEKKDSVGKKLQMQSLAWCQGTNTSKNAYCQSDKGTCKDGDNINKMCCKLE